MNPYQKISHRKKNKRDRDPELRLHSREERPERAAGIGTPGMTNRPPLRRSNGSVKYLQATAKITRTSWSTQANLLLLRILPKERERILGRVKRLQEAGRTSRTTSSDRQTGTSDHVGSSDDPSVSASSQHWTEE